MFAPQHIVDLMWDDLLIWRDFLIGMLLLSTKVVVVGLFLEGPELCLEIRSIVRHKRFKRKFHFSLPEDHIPDWVKAVAFVGWIFIVVGVAGELVTESLIPDVDATIQSFVTVSLEDARRESSLAILRASINELEEQKLKNENLKLEAVVQPRTISFDDRKKIGAELRQFSQSFKGRKVKISSLMNDAEGMLFSLEIIDLLTRADIDVDVSGAGTLMWIGWVQSGVKITGNGNDRHFISKLGKRINSSAGTHVTEEWNPKYSETTIFVGVKPIPGLPSQPPKYSQQKPTNNTPISH